MNPLTDPQELERRRAGWFTTLLLVVNLVGDGWSGRPSLVLHQLLLLPCTALFAYAVWQLLQPGNSSVSCPFQWTAHRALLLALLFESLFYLIFFFEARHFAWLGYHLQPISAALVFTAALILIAMAAARKLNATATIFVAVCTYAAGIALAIAAFPLNYLRSDMLPVITWADDRILRHLNPYATIYVGSRVYDFPYLPGMMIAYLPFAALHLDPRTASIFYLGAAAMALYGAAHRTRRLEVAALLAVFLLCPFLQYRHELYLQPHWCALVISIILMQRRHFIWAAFVFGISMGIYQFSWILLPFILLNAFRRRGALEALKLTVSAAAGALLILGPFLPSAFHRIGRNTVSQWSLLPHADADPINLSFWATYLIRPDRLLWLQIALMVILFVVCVLRRRCLTTADTLRCMVAALAIFIVFNVLIDGYFFLMWLVLALLYTLVANNWLAGSTLADATEIQTPTLA